MFKKIFVEHKIFIYIILIIIIAAYITNFFVNKNTIILGGEYIFSFDHWGHVQNILHDPRSILAQDNTNCYDCPDFYHYSRWYSLFKIGYHSFSQFLQLHPFIFLVLSMILTQLLSLYIFTRTILGEIKWLPYLIASFVFILYPYKYSLLIETHDGLLYSNMLLYITVLIWSYKNLKFLTIPKLFGAALITGTLLSFFLNVNLAFLPIALYTSLIITVIFYKQILANSKKACAYLSVIVPIALLSNIPLISSLVENGNSRHYEGYISFNAVDSFLSGLSISQTAPQIIFIFAVLFILCFLYAPLQRKYKIWILVVYFFIGVIIYGNNSPVNIYGWMFEHMPLMDSLRATYRFMFFELIIFFIIIYFALRKLQEGNIFQLLIFGILSAIFIYLPLQHIYTNKDYFFMTGLPIEYFEVQKYLNETTDKKVYFPPKVPLFHNIATDYTWGDTKYNKSILLYKNPYTSLLPINNLVQFERFPYLLSPTYLELSYFSDLSVPPKDIIRAMELRGIAYIIVDRNYKWNEIYPEVDLDTLSRHAKVEKRFGNIIVLRLRDKSKECKKGYGQITLEYCTSYGADTKLFNKSKEEFLLETRPEMIGRKLEVRRNSIYTKSVLDPILHQSFVENKIFFGNEIMQISGNQSDVLSTHALKSGKHSIYIALFKYTNEGNLMKNANISVRVSNRVIRSISPYTNKPGIYWERVEVNLEEGQKVSVDIQNEGYVVMPFVPIIKSLN